MKPFHDPRLWGPSAWIFLHFVTFCYPDEPSDFQKEQFRNFFHSLQFVLPCSVCRDHYKAWLNLYPVDKYLSNKSHLEEWIYLMHNYVNLRLDKKLIGSEKEAEILILKRCQSK
jgi:hypothetical protein